MTQELKDDEEVMFRQVHPSFVHEGQILGQRSAQRRRTQTSFRWTGRR